MDQFLNSENTDSGKITIDNNSEQLAEQLKREIKKNKNLLQTNFTLVQQNQQYITGFTKIKNYLNFSENQGEQSVSPDELQELINIILERLAHSHYYSQINTHSNNKDSEVIKKCQCNKWKQLYMKQSQQSFRLSQYSSQLVQKINTMQINIKNERQQINYIMEEYLKLYRRIHSIQFMQSHNSLQEKGEREKDRKKSKQNQRNNSSSGHKRLNNSKHKNNMTNSSRKIKKEAQKDHEIISLDMLNNLSKNCTQLQYLNHLTKFAQGLVIQNTQYREELIKIREDINNKEILLRVYRQKQRTKYLSNYFQNQTKMLQGI